MSDYEQRAEMFHFAGPEELKTVLKREGCVVMDVRSEEEIQQDGKFQAPTCAWVQRACAPSGPCDLVDKKLDDLLPNKLAPIVVYCKSGRRAARATEFLKSQGYDHVVNAGGLDDLKEMDLL